MILAKYTVELKTLMENEEARKMLNKAMSTYPLYSKKSKEEFAPSYIPTREELNSKILNFYKYREIAFETPGRFLDELEVALIEIMPYYNQLFFSADQDYNIIYNVLNDIEAALKGMLDPVFEEKVLGHAEVRQTWKVSGVGTIAGAYVLDGMFERDCQVRIVRDGIVVYDGQLASLKRFKDDVKEVRTGFECGLSFERYNDVKEGDVVEAFKMVEIPR